MQREGQEALVKELLAKQRTSLEEDMRRLRAEMGSQHDEALRKSGERTAEVTSNPDPNPNPNPNLPLPLPLTLTYPNLPLPLPLPLTQPSLVTQWPRAGQQRGAVAGDGSTGATRSEQQGQPGSHCAYGWHRAVGDGPRLLYRP